MRLHLTQARRAVLLTVAAAIATTLTAALITGCSPTEPAKPLTAAGEQRDFTGTWNAAGTRRSMALGGDRRASLIQLRGPLLLAGADRPGVGFNAEVFALVDTATGLVGRAVWTDERGDQVFSELTGEGTAASNRITGTIVGGSGRYAGVTGGYEFSWRFVLEADDGSIQGSALGLKGRVTRKAGAPGSTS